MVRNPLYGAIRNGLRKIFVKALAVCMPPAIVLDHRHFDVWQERGYHITSVDYYSPIPNTQELSEEIFQRRSELAGIDINERGQLALIDKFVYHYREEYSKIPDIKTNIPHQYYLMNSTFGPVDGEILYCMIRHLKPGQIYEIGSGNSTYLSAQALLENRKRDGVSGELFAVEPYPGTLPILREGFPGLTRLIQKKAQDIPLSAYGQLEENDILFIDSSHVGKIGSDVEYLYLEVLPRLKKGVLIHSHDVFIPAEYPPEVVKAHHFFWNEQYLLQALLTFNDRFEVLWGSYYMHLNHPDRLRIAFPSYDNYCNKHTTLLPASFWIRKIK